MAQWNYVVEFDVERLSAEVHVNGWPVCRSHTTAGRLTNIKISPWLVEGENVFQIYLGAPVDDDNMPELDPNGYVQPNGLIVSLFKLDGDERPAENPPMLVYRWMEECHPLPEEGLTLVYEHRFRMEEAFGRFAWEDALPYAETDRPAILEVVRAFREALDRHDVETIIEMQKVRLEELGRCAGMDYDGMAEDHRKLLDKLMDPGIVVQPFVAEDFVLRSGAAGRLVQVEREGGDMRTIGVQSPIGIGGSYPLCMSNLNGTWTIVR